MASSAVVVCVYAMAVGTIERSDVVNALLLYRLAGVSRWEEAIGRLEAENRQFQCRAERNELCDGRVRHCGRPLAPVAPVSNIFHELLEYINGATL